MQQLALPYKDVTYCKYGYPYKKRNRIWNSLAAAWQSKPICDRWSRCGHFVTACKRLPSSNGAAGAVPQKGSDDS